jgi:DNA-binding NarL/FixJ family response regulator
MVTHAESSIDMAGPTTTGTRVVLIDDHASLRESLAHWLRQASFDVLAEYGRADDALGPIERMRPDIVLMDIDMPGLEAFAAARQVMQRCPETRVVFLSAFTNDVYIEQVLEMGAAGYLCKTERPAEIVDSLRAVADGGVCYSAQVRERLVIDDGGARLGDAKRTRASLLTPRELEILRYVSQGMSHREIAEAAGVRPKTVDNHVSNIMNKLKIHDRVELALFAVREGVAAH